MSSDNFKSEIANQIRTQRQNLGISQYELADRLKVKQSLVARLEAGKQNPSLVTLHKIAQALECDLEVILKPNK